MLMDQTLSSTSITYKRTILTLSEIIAFNRCRQFHDYRYRQLLTPKEENENLTLWLAVNRGLSVWYSSLDKALALIAVKDSLQNSQYQSQLLPLINGMLDGYFKHWQQHDDFKVQHIDRPYITPIITPSGRASRIQDLAGIAPLIIKKADSSNWLMIHRTISRKDPNLNERLESDLRIHTACWALNRYLPNGIKGVIVNVLRSKLPVEPEILKNGSVSKRKNIDTTLEVFARALNRSCSNNHADYADILERLQKEENSFFIRYERSYSAEELSDIGQKLYRISRDMRRASREQPYGNSNSCTAYGLCPYLDLCAGRLNQDTAEEKFITLNEQHPSLAKVDCNSLRLTSKHRRKGNITASRNVSNEAYIQ